MENTSNTKLFVIVALVLCYLSVSCGGTILTSPIVTNWGTWGTFQRCPAGSFVTGFQLKTERWNHGSVAWDDSCLNSVKFYCGRVNEPTTESITSGEGQWGSWGHKLDCDGYGYAIGFSLRSEEANTAMLDETAANNLRVLCAGSTNGFLEGDGEVWGEWTSPRICAAEQYICGIQTQVEEPQGIFGDDTALNNLRVECCDLTVSEMNRFNVTKISSYIKEFRDVTDI